MRVTGECSTRELAFSRTMVRAQSTAKNVLNFQIPSALNALTTLLSLEGAASGGLVGVKVGWGTISSGGSWTEPSMKYQIIT